MPTGWLNVDSSMIDSHCGDAGGDSSLAGAIDATGSGWVHTANEVHEFVLNLGSSHNLTKFKGISNFTGLDPTDIDIYVSADGIDWGAAVASGIDTWQNTAVPVEVDSTDKIGQYIKVVINSTEHANDWLGWGIVPMEEIFDAYESPVIKLLAGTIEAQSALAGDVNSVESLAGLVEAQVALVGGLVGTLPLSGSVIAASSLMGSLVGIFPLFGSVNAQSSLTGYIQFCYGSIPPAMHAALIDPYSGGAWLWLVEIAIPGYSTIKIARNPVDIVYGELTYLKDNFDVGLEPLTADGSVPRTVLRVAQDADYTLEDKLNATQGGYGGTVTIIRAHEDFLTTPIIELEQIVDILTSNSDTKDVVIICGVPNPLLSKIPLRRGSSKICPYSSPGLFKGPECQYSGADATCTGKYEDCFTKGNAVHWGAELGLDPAVTGV